MCQICTCNNPNHRCPLNCKEFNDKTNYNKDYVPHEIQKPDLWGARDNLKFKKMY